ncbi:uncharacterized protein I303_106636 [Kwoniella dejecticola CBS 10117]|uniref:NuA3 HAT complex component NTO1 n=1 Tax=Kwoniella dejecticola CBS 10117 TaxID=1296121 RepID=A0AAJ8KUW4_9TREE
MPLESNADKAYMHDLPKVSFRVVDDDLSMSAPAGVQSEQSRSYGYNDFSDFTRSEHYIRYIEPIESELAVQVEYDMDEQDQEWLDAINAERKKEQSGPISYEIFEILMDKLEKEWFSLSKRIPQPTQHLAAEDSKCAVCDDGEGENSNAIVFCDGCNLAVHQDCYGVPYIPEGQWLCRKCTVSPENPVSCVFCPNEGGAFKQTTSGHWAHLLCSIWIPETGVGNVVYMEPVEGVETVPKSRWKLVCSLCREKTGACIQCDNRNCFTAFHVTCARQIGLLTSMNSPNHDGGMKAFCHKHLPADSREDTETASDYSSSFSDAMPSKMTQKKIKHRRPSLSNNGHVQVAIPSTKKSAQAHSKSFKPGPPIIPRLILNKVLDYVAKVVMRKRQPFVERLCRYWSLKREARRGAPLLKRLHLEPWTASASSRQQTDAEKAQKLKFLQILRNDLEKVRMLAELVRKREKEKLRQAHAIKDTVDSFIFPCHGRLRVALGRISAMDRSELYLNPVSRLDAPDYYQVIKEPMCWLWIDEKLEKNGYLDVAEFKRDIMLVLDNAMLYNPKDSPFHRRAAKIKKDAEPVLKELDVITATVRPALEHDSFSSDILSPTGDLEPLTATLSALLLRTSGAEDPSQDYLSSIFSFELEKPKEPTPPPPPKAPKAPRKSNAERRQLWEAREAAAKERSLLGTRPTRAALAAEQAFNREAGVVPSSPADAEPKAEGTDARSRRRSVRESNATAGPSTPASTRKGKKQPHETANAYPAQKHGTDASAAPISSALKSLTTSGSASPTKSSTSLPNRHRSQPGVAGFETVHILTDKERREQERALDIMTQEVGSQDQFKRFNVGWVLPEGSKRKRSERTSESLPRAQSTMSSRKPPSATASKARASSTPRVPPLSLSPIKSQSVKLEDPLSGSGSELSPPPSSALTSAASTPKKTEQKGKRKASTPAEETSTPRQSKRAKRDDDRLEDEDVEMSSVPDKSTRGEVLDRGEGVAEESGPMGTGPNSPAAEDLPRDEPSKGKRKPVPVNKSPIKAKEPVDEDTYASGTLVHSFPYFPAEIVDPTGDEEIPKDVLKIEEKERAIAKAANKRIWLVQFYDNTFSYGWIMEDRLDLLGEDQDIDAMYLSGKERGKYNRYKSNALKSVRKGYQLALADLQSAEEEEDEDEDEAEA